MAEKKWYLLSYDVRDPRRLRQAAKSILGRGTRVQYSVYRCRLTRAEKEKLLWEMGKVLEEEDSLMIIGLCGSCVSRIEQTGTFQDWPQVEDSFDII
jgi:CRISPR-associated protein Cas2